MELPDWLRAFGIVGETPTGYALVRLTEDGDLYSYLVGDYEGTVVPVTLDAEGRLSAFVVDSSDVWEQIVQVGNAELAVRLGAMTRWDARGRVIFQDSFESGLNGWFVTEAGTGASVDLVPDPSVTGGYSVGLTAGSDGNHRADVYRLISVIPGNTLGCEAVFSMDSEPENVSLYLETYTKSGGFTPGLRYDAQNHNVDLYVEPDTWTTIDADKELYVNRNMFHYLKVVCDLSTGKYVRALVGGESYDLSAYDIDTWAAAVPGRVVSVFRNNGNSGSNDIVYLDRMIITQAEP